MKGKYSREKAIQLLIEKQNELNAQGLSRYPQRADFNSEEVCGIKAFLGPWPRALEAAGLKPPRDDGYLERKKEKRRRAKLREAERRRQARSEEAPKEDGGAKEGEKYEEKDL